MNCKPGDLAVVVHSAAGNEGLLVTCLRLLPGAMLLRPNGTTERGSAWEIDRNLVGWDGVTRGNVIFDYQLSPIRDPGEDAQDETLSWIPVPERDEVAA